MLLGFVTSNPEMYTDQNGRGIRLQLTTIESFFKNGLETQHKEVHSIIIHQKISRQDTIHVGEQLYNEGSLKTKSFTDTQGIRRYGTHIVCNRYEKFKMNVQHVELDNEPASELSGNRAFRPWKRKAES